MKTQQEILDSLRSILVDHLPNVTLEMVTDDANLKKDLGADSLDLIELVLYAEEQLGFEISDEVLEKIEDVTVGEIATCLFEAQPKS